MRVDSRKALAMSNACSPDVCPLNHTHTTTTTTTAVDGKKKSVSAHGHAHEGRGGGGSGIGEQTSGYRPGLLHALASRVMDVNASHMLLSGAKDTRSLAR